MIAYFDTSAVIPLIIEEPHSEDVGEVWDHASRLVSSRLLYPEGRAALAQAHRMNRLTTRQLRTAARDLEVLGGQLDHVEVTDDLANRAGELAEAAALRGYDAVHLAAAESIADGDLVMVTGDAALRQAATDLGMAVVILASRPTP